MPRQDSKHSGAHKPAKNPHRAAAFREAARAIVFKDRYDRRAGMSVDTAGAIARALERAYAQGFADAQAPSPGHDRKPARGRPERLRKVSRAARMDPDPTAATRRVLGDLPVHARARDGR